MNVLLRATAGLIVWAIGFSLLYGLHGIACARGWQAGAGSFDSHRWMLIATWSVAIAVGAWLNWRMRAATGFAGRLARTGAAVGIVATVATGIPVIVFPGCL